MECQVRSADRTFFEGDATMVVARSARGEFAVLDGHAPLLATLRSGPLRIQTAEGERVFAGFGGTLHVSEDAAVTVLLEDAVALEEIDLTTPDASTSDLGESAELEETRERLAVLRAVKETYG
ncbi:MAG: hypothetical protein WBC63_02265 [Candidatus Bipolaricaulia bacterium]